MSFEDLAGKVLTRIEEGNDRITFFVDDGTAYTGYHMPDCCESVTFQETRGDIDDSLGSPILEAEEIWDSKSNPPEHPESFTWTFWRLRTAKGEVTFVWLGESNGYHGETPNFNRTHGDRV